jgi:hypothetical protein
MSSSSGRTLPLSLPRRIQGDLAHFALRTPTATLERRMSLLPLIKVRDVAQPQPSWLAIFLKAFAVGAGRWSELRRAYLSFPWPHLYEHPVNVTAVALEQRSRDEDVQFFHTITCPEQHGLLELDAELERMRETAVESVGAWKRFLWVSRVPQPLRRLIWWLGLNVSGARRVQWFGTQTLISVAEHGCNLQHVLSPCATALTYGPQHRDGTVTVGLTFDQRVLDAGTAARALEEFERVLLGEIANEMRYLKAIEAA